MCETNKTFLISFLSCFLTRGETDFHKKAASGVGMSKISLMEGGRGGGGGGGGGGGVGKMIKIWREFCLERHE